MNNDELSSKLELIAAQRLIVGKALLELLEDGHWRGSHDSFDAFIKEEFNMSRADADELMLLAKTLR
jgi:hypothetical protein